MAQRTVFAGTERDIAQGSKLIHVIGHLAVGGKADAGDTLVIHILSLDDDGQMALGRLLGNSQRLGHIGSRSAVGAGTLDRDIDRSQMVYAQRIDTILGIPRLRRFGRR